MLIVIIGNGPIVPYLNYFNNIVYSPRMLKAIKKNTYILNRVNTKL